MIRFALHFLKHMFIVLKVGLKTMVHLRDNGIRPYIELEPTVHPLAIEQRAGITVERVAEIYSLMMHQEGKSPLTR
jgi:hypothetical protein